MKHEWKKTEKQFYLPKNKPEFVAVPEFKFFAIDGAGNPNDSFFNDYITVLYALSYAVRMSPKNGVAPANYYEYTVYPLEGIWDLNEEGRRKGSGPVSKDDLVFKLMIRQPGFVDAEFASQVIAQTARKKPMKLLEKVRFESLKEGDCIQMMHHGSYDNETASFKLMEEYARLHGLERKEKTHREIYISDPRKVSSEKLRTVLRFGVTSKTF